MNENNTILEDYEISNFFRGLLKKFSETVKNKYLGIEYLIQKAIDEKNLLLLEDFSMLIDEIDVLKNKLKKRARRK